MNLVFITYGFATFCGIVKLVWVGHVAPLRQGRSRDRRSGREGVYINWELVRHAQCAVVCAGRVHSVVGGSGGMLPQENFEI